MRTLYILVLFAISFSLFAQDKKNEEQFLAEVKRINDLLDMLESTDKEVQSLAQNELLRYGRNALPFLEEKISKKGASVYLDVIKKIVYPSGLSNLPELKDIPKPTKEEIEKYVYFKLCEANLYYKQGRYSEAYNIVSSIAKLEPTSAFKDKIEHLAKLSNQKLFHLTILSANLSTTNDFYEVGDKIVLSLKMQNVSGKQINIIYGANKGSIIIDIDLRYMDSQGNETTLQYSDVVEIEGKVTMGKEGTWEKKYEIDTTRASIDIERFRRYYIFARMTPQKLEVEDRPIYTEITFEPIIVKVYKKGTSKIKNKALETLGKAIDKGTSEDVFLCVTLLKEGEKDAGIELLMQALKHIKNPSSRQTIFTSLTYLTGLPYGSDQERWEGWWQEREKK